VRNKSKNSKKYSNRLIFGVKQKGSIIVKNTGKMMMILRNRDK
jgi:hypothetical protein